MASVVFAGVIAFLAFVIYRLILGWQFSQFGIYVYQQIPGECHVIPGVDQGSEDIDILQDGTVFISSGIGLGDPSEKPWVGRRGKILRYNIHSPDLPAKELTLAGFPKDRALNPHGISVYTDPKGASSLFVISHYFPAPDHIDIFTFDPKRPDILTWQESIQSENMRFVNDITATGPQSFYFTNFFHYNHGVMKQLEFKGKFYWGGIGHCSGTSCKVLDTGMFQPNGINMSPDKSILYVSHIGDAEIRVYRSPDPTNRNNIELIQAYPVYSIVDNINIDASTGHLWVGSIPNCSIPAIHENDPDLTIPVASQVLRVIPGKDGKLKTTQQMYADDGTSEDWLMSTSALHRDGNLLIGSLMTKALHCRI